MQKYSLAIIFGAVLLLAGAAALPGEFPWQTGWPVAHAQTDPISGKWEGAFKVMTFTEPCTLDLKLDGKTVTGTINSDHTGAGKVVNGTYIDGKLAFTAEFAKHESIALTGAAKDGKLGGEFTTEGHTGTWEVVKK